MSSSSSSLGTTASEFFGPWEDKPLDSLEKFLDLIGNTFSRWSGKDVHYAWRGVRNAEWPLHSALYRRLVSSTGTLPSEFQLEQYEAQIMADAHRWGLHFHERAHLPILYQLAMLQHFGAPTRFIDVTFNPLIALYFAVEEQVDEKGTDTCANEDGRLLIFDVSGRMINESSSSVRSWEETYRRPWRAGAKALKNWNTSFWAWRPAGIEPRFAAQNSAFIFGGVPMTGKLTWPKSASSSATWGIEDVKGFTSVPLRLHKLEKQSGRPPDNPTMTIRVTAASKPSIRTQLRRWFDIEARTVFPDYPGFAARGIG